MCQSIIRLEGRDDLFCSFPSSDSSYEFRYVEPGQALTSFVFIIPLDQCGTELARRRSEIGSAENVMIVQLDPLVQVNINSQSGRVSISSIVQ